MTDRYSDPSYDGVSDPYADEELTDDPVDEPTTRLSPAAREHLAQARAALQRPTDRRQP